MAGDHAWQRARRDGGKDWGEEVELAASDLSHLSTLPPSLQLPIKYVGYSTCFRKEAGSHGRDTLGIFR